MCMERMLPKKSSSHLENAIRLAIVWPSSTTVRCDTHALRRTYGGGAFLDGGIMEATKRVGEAWETKGSFKLSGKGLGVGWA